MRICTPRSASFGALPLALALLVLASAAGAVDGVVEINQAKALAGGVTPTDTAGFPVLIDSPGSYRLTSDVSVPTGLDGIEIDSDDVTLDLNGFTLSCTGACNTTGSGIQGSGAANVTVRDGTIRDFAVNNVVLGDDGRADRVRSFESNWGIRIGARGVVTNSTAFSATAVGILGSTYCVVSDNVISSGAGDGIIVSDNSIVRGNVVQGNLGTGISCTRCNVTDNTIRVNGMDGIDAGFNSTVVANTVEENGGDGIEVEGGVVTENTVSNNTAFGLNGNANTGYGRNVLSFNNSNMDQVSMGPLETDANICHGDLTCP